MPRGARSKLKHSSVSTENCRDASAVSHTVPDNVRRTLELFSGFSRPTTLGNVIISPVGQAQELLYEQPEEFKLPSRDAQAVDYSALQIIVPMLDTLIVSNHPDFIGIQSGGSWLATGLEPPIYQIHETSTALRVCDIGTLSGMLLSSEAPIVQIDQTYEGLLSIKNLAEPNSTWLAEMPVVGRQLDIMPIT